MMEANFAAGDFGVSVRDEVKATTKIRLQVFFENIAGVGQPSFKVIATDGEGDSASVDILYTPLKVVEGDSGGFMSTGVLVGAVSIAVLVALLMTLQRRRATAEEMKIIDSWGVFGDGLVEEQDADESPSESEKLDWDAV